MRVVDLTHTINSKMPVYPGTPQPIISQTSTCGVDGFNESSLSFYSHVGTHMDPPAHVFAQGKTLDMFEPAQFMGKALIIDCTSLKEGQAISVAQLSSYADHFANADFLLFNLGWDKFWGTPKYFGNYPCLDEKALHLITSGSFKGIGFDVMGPDPIESIDLPRHKKLLSQSNCVIIENLCNLAECPRGLFDFSCFPLKVISSNGAPVRAVAWFEK